MPLGTGMGDLPATAAVLASSVPLQPRLQGTTELSWIQQWLLYFPASAPGFSWSTWWTEQERGTYPPLPLPLSSADPDFPTQPDWHGAATALELPHSLVRQRQWQQQAREEENEKKRYH